MFRTPVDRFCTIALVEGVSAVLLFFIAMPVKYGLQNDILVKIIGTAHGALWVIYMFSLLEVWVKEKWAFGKVFLGGVSGVIPGLSFWFEKKVRREAQPVDAV